jgi:simple sugar transport system permease protein
VKLPHRHRPLLASLIALALLYAAACLRYADDNFFSLAVFLNLFRDNAVLGVIAVGMTFVILSGGIDLSVGAVMSLCSVVIGVLIAEQGWHPLAAMAAGVAVGASLGAAMGGLIQATGLKPFIVTLAGMFFARGLGYVIHLESVGIDDPRHLQLALFGLSPAPGVKLPLTTLVLLAVVLLGTYLSIATPFGRSVYALGGSEESARLMGLRIGRTKIAVYTLSGLCAGLAGVTLTLYQSSGSHVEGVGLELDAIAAVVIGGTLLTGGVGSVAGTLVGVLIIGILLTAITTYEPHGFSSGFTKVLIGGLLLAFVLVQRVLSPGRRG